MEFTRRRLLCATAGAAGTGLLGGCISGAGGEAGPAADGATARASFFVFGDIADRVAGDTAEADLLVPVGQHGHGWEPGPSVREDVRDADLFVHGMEGFQPWVDDIEADLEADDAGVRSVDVTEGVDLLAADSEHDHEEGHDGDEDSHDEGEHDEDEHDEGSHDEGEHDEDSHDEDGHDESEHDEDSHDEGEHDEDSHDHGDGADPHFWMDPLRVKEAVGVVREGLVDIDPENADVYAENAESFREDLDELHGRLESTVEAGSKEVLLVAGHDSFQYLAERYGIEVHALTGLSPDEQPTARDIERAQEVVEAHDLAYICADPLESQEAARRLVEETDAEDVLPLTAMPGRTEEWASEGWGYAAVMENVNLPTLSEALEA